MWSFFRKAFGKREISRQVVHVTMPDLTGGVTEDLAYVIDTDNVDAVRAEMQGRQIGSMFTYGGTEEWTEINHWIKLTPMTFDLEQRMERDKVNLISLSDFQAEVERRFPKSRNTT